MNQEHHNDTRVRIEMEWNDAMEELINSWKVMCAELSKKHEESGYKNKQLYTFWALPNIMLSIIMSGISGVFSENENIKYITMTGFTVTGILTGISNHFNFGMRQQQHFDYANRFADLALEIESEMIKTKPFRQQADVFITRIKMMLEHIQCHAPNL